MNPVPNSWRDYGLPIVVCVGVVSTCNFLVNWVFTGWPHQLPVYLVGSLVALVFLTLAVSRGVVSARDIGLSPSGWKPQHRLLGIGVPRRRRLQSFLDLVAARPDGQPLLWSAARLA